MVNVNNCNSFLSFPFFIKLKHMLSFTALNKSADGSQEQ